MTYEEFLAAWNEALMRSELRPGLGTTTTLELGSLDRVARVSVEPYGGQDREPFFVTARLSFRWTPMLTARAATVEEDVLTELLGRAEVEGLDTDRPWVRVDLELRATLPYGHPLPFPDPARWAAWAREASARVAELDAVIVEDEEDDEPGPDGLFAIGAWQGTPTATFTCGSDGALALERLELAAWQAIRIPRSWDDPDREEDEHPDAQLRRMVGRVRRALHVWMEVLDHLTPARAS